MTEYENRSPKAQIDLIDGDWQEPVTELGGSLDDPNTGTVRQKQLATDATDVERGLAAAHRLHESEAWGSAPVERRVELLDRIADGLSERVQELGYEDALATGNPLGVATLMASFLGPRVRSARDQLLEVGVSRTLPAGSRDVRVLRRPLGPAVVIAPWNAPTFVGVAKVASALAAGCPVILKPSEWAPAGCQIVAEVIQAAVAELGLPSAVFQLVHGAAGVGSQLVSDPRVRAISFTGGGNGGRAVAAAAAPHFTALQLELGGHNPAVVMPDADIALTAAAIAEGMTKLNGQWCEAPGKILVAAERHDELVDALLEELSQLTVGHCLDDATDIGPLAHASHREHLSGLVNHLVEAGGKALSRSELPDLGGWFFAPTVVVGTHASQSMGELFGPAVSIHSVGSVEEAVRASHGPETGLAGFVFGSDLDAAMDVAARVPAGEIRVNGCKLADLADGSEQEFWNNAGIGAHGPTDMVRFFQGRRTVGVDDLTLPV
ncbi:aldehyde dehydrogenase family protein [Streptomyces sp. SID8361]|uniref:aldehyde dehydrogenase family protein n=1 Tax=Streptomyces sp. MnatMP-M27 TaxID=1839768 RepID=UPI00081EA823|nr:aldehyde dehydrogenase [Streptomyces sp. MnatMP-M27]MYU11087.1 aldehyde dehydrogenase family protein [Streptomyces sp. SID8361]SCF78171.1 phenylacetaldehyde dehydrogenase [Streptomyces sp. MnatMP-M27]